MGAGAGKHLQWRDEDPLQVECGERMFHEGAIAALSSFETISAGLAGTGAAGPSLRRWRRLVFALALAALVFAALNPYLDAMDSCGEPGCPEFSQAHAQAPAELPPEALVTVLAVVSAWAFVGRVWRRRASDRKPPPRFISLPSPTHPGARLVGEIFRGSAAGVSPYAHGTFLERCWCCRRCRKEIRGCWSS